MKEKLTFQQRIEMRFSQNKAFYQEKNKAVEDTYRKYENSDKKEEIHRFIYGSQP